MFYRNYVILCNKRNISPSAAAEEMGFHRSDVTRWSKGSQPRQATLQKIADYFCVPVSELLKEEAPALEGERINDEDVKAAFFRGADPTLTEEEMDKLWADAKNYMMYTISQMSRKETNGQ